MRRGGSYTFFESTNAGFLTLCFSDSVSDFFWPVLDFVVIFIITAVPQTQETHILCVAKLKTQEKRDDLEILTDVPVVISIVHKLKDIFH